VEGNPEAPDFDSEVAISFSLEEPGDPSQLRCLAYANNATPPTWKCQSYDVELSADNLTMVGWTSHLSMWTVLDRPGTRIAACEGLTPLPERAYSLAAKFRARSCEGGFRMHGRRAFCGELAEECACICDQEPMPQEPDDIESHALLGVVLSSVGAAVVCASLLCGLWWFKPCRKRRLDNEEARAFNSDLDEASPPSKHHAAMTEEMLSEVPSQTSQTENSTPSLSSQRESTSSLQGEWPFIDEASGGTTLEI